MSRGRLSKYSHCQHCGVDMYLRKGRILYCSAECKRKSDLARWKKASAAKYKPVDHDDRNCEYCRESFKPKTDIARFCSTKCRVANHRKAIITCTGYLSDSD